MKNYLPLLGGCAVIGSLAIALNDKVQGQTPSQALPPRSVSEFSYLTVVSGRPPGATADPETTIALSADEFVVHSKSGTYHVPQSAVATLKVVGDK